VRILITDLTRMAQGYICVAGIDVETGRRVRPVIGERLPANLVSTRGGPFDVRRVVDLGGCRPEGVPPEVEDVRFDPATAKHVQTITGAAFFSRLQTVAMDGLAAFGPSLVPMGNNGRATPERVGLRSLVITWAKVPFRVYVSSRGTLRVRLADDLDLSVTDIRLYQDDFQTPDPVKVRWLNGQLARGGEVYLSYGLSRPFRRSADDRPHHWLQLNNIHLEVAPDWQLRWPRERYRP
jgi:hypothetical protein